MKPFGVHLRINDKYSTLLKQTANMGATACQFFFVPQNEKKQLKVTLQDQEEFLRLNKNLTVFGHCTYWINPATNNAKNKKISIATLKKEIAIAKKLGIKHLVLHGGNAKGHTDRTDGIKSLAKILQKLDCDDITLLIENTTHGGMSICSDLDDFVILRELIPNSKFCLDTAHAFAYGYNLEETETFIELLDKTMGTQNIKLIHLNDSAQICGSKIDQHKIPGNGLIGKNTLLRLAKHKKLRHIPIISEPPPGETNLTKTVMELREYL